MSPVARPARSRARWRAGALLAVTVTASACAPLPPAPPAAAAQRQAAAAFELEGRLSASDGQQAASGTLSWTHARGRDTLTLYTPLGQIAARLDSGPAGASLHLADGSRVDAPDVAQLLPRVLGVEVPVERLGRWVQAAPTADAEVRVRDAAGRPAVVIDQGWRIDYPAYAADHASALPARIDITRGDTRLRLVIDTWTLQP